MKARKPEVKVGQIWYNSKTDTLLCISNEKTVVWGMWRNHDLDSLFENLNFESDNYYYVGEL